MNQKQYDVVVVGGGPAGMAAAIEAKQAGMENVVVLEQQAFLGGVLPQCIHDGFGVQSLRKNMTGPEYAAYYRHLLTDLKIEYHLSTTVMSISADKEVDCVGETLGAVTIRAGAVILATGCKERSRGAMRIPGTRPAGVYTAGAAQHMMNIQNYLPGKSVVILGLGDIGLIMARRLTLEGAKVKLVLGLEASGLERNMVQCIRDFDIHLKLGYTVVSLHGVKRLKGVTIAKIKNGREIAGGEDRTGSEEFTGRQYIPCDTLLLAAGLLPDSEIALAAGVETDAANGGIRTDEEGRTSVSGIFACGNVAEIYDLVDYVTLAGKRTGLAAAEYVKNHGAAGTCAFAEQKRGKKKRVAERKGNPEMPEDTDDAKYRICILCPQGCLLKGTFDGEWTISGHECAKGKQYGLQEILNPLRTLTTTVKIRLRGPGASDDPAAVVFNRPALLPVKTDHAIPKDRLSAVMKCCRKTTLEKPVKLGEIVIANVADTGANIVACDTWPG